MLRYKRYPCGGPRSGMSRTTSVQICYGSHHVGGKQVGLLPPERSLPSTVMLWPYKDINPVTTDPTSCSHRNS